MTEKEKLQAGELYNANDRELLAERAAAKSSAWNSTQQLTMTI